MFREVNSSFMRSLAILLSFGLFLSAFQYHERWEDQPLEEYTVQQVGEDHIFCPACLAVFTCCAETAPGTSPDIRIDTQSFSLTDPQITSVSFSEKESRAPPL